MTTENKKEDNKIELVHQVNEQLTQKEVDLIRAREKREMNMVYDNDATEIFYKLPITDEQREDLYNEIMANYKKN